MTERLDAAFLRAIIEQPDDITHRMVYADFLEEHADNAFDRVERSELIRVQCALTRRYLDQVERARFGDREASLLGEPGDPRRQLLARPLDLRAAKGHEFRRGFV